MLGFRGSGSGNLEGRSGTMSTLVDDIDEGVEVEHEHDSDETDFEVEEGEGE